MNLLKKSFENLKHLSPPVKASLAFVFCSFFQRGISILTTPVFTRLLSPGQYGYYTIFNSWLEIISVFTTLKLAGSVFQQALVKYDTVHDELTASIAGLGTTISLIMYCLYLPFRKNLNHLLGMDTLIISCIFIASWASLMFELWADRQRNEFKYKSLLFLTIFSSVAKPILGVIAVSATNEYKAEARIVSIVFVETVAYSGLFFMFLRRGPFFSRRFWKYALTLNIPLIPHYLTRMVLNQSDRLMIKSLVGLSEAGIYGLAHSLAWMLTLITSAILNTMNPWMFQKIKQEDGKKIGKASYVILILVGFIGLTLISVAPEIVRIFAPIEYYSAIWVIPPLVLSVYFLFMYSLFACFEYYYEKTSLLTFASSVGGILNIVLNYYFIKSYGFVAAGYTTLFCYILFAFMHFLFMRKIQKEEMGGLKPFDGGILIGISGSFIGIALVITATYKSLVVRYCIALVLLSIMIAKKNRIISIIREIKIIN